MAINRPKLIKKAKLLLVIVLLLLVWDTFIAPKHITIFHKQFTLPLTKEKIGRYFTLEKNLESVRVFYPSQDSSIGCNVWFLGSVDMLYYDNPGFVDAYTKNVIIIQIDFVAKGKISRDKLFYEILGFGSPTNIERNKKFFISHPGTEYTFSDGIKVREVDGSYSLRLPFVFTFSALRDPFFLLFVILVIVAILILKNIYNNFRKFKSYLIGKKVITLAWFFYELLYLIGFCHYAFFYFYAHLFLM